MVHIDDKTFDLLHHDLRLAIRNHRLLNLEGITEVLVHINPSMELFLLRNMPWLHYCDDIRDRSIMGCRLVVNKNLQCPYIIYEKSRTNNAS